MNISRVFSTQERLTILRQVIYTVAPVSVSDVALVTDLSKGLVSKYLDMLREEGVLERVGARYGVVDGVETRAVRIMLNLEAVASFRFERYSFIRGVGLFGSGAKGSNTERSDVDLWVLVRDAGEEDLAGLTRDLRLSLGDVRPLFLTEEKLGMLKLRDLPFYYSLLQGSVAVYGESLEAV